jgi:CheY-like chemotaxis protein
VQPFGAGEVLEVLLEDKTELHLLLVDDVPSCRKMLARLLMTELCVCDEAKDGVEAVAKVKAAILSGYLYDGIFMDASMPNMTGSDATQAIRALGYEGRIFGVTGNSLPEDVEEFLFKGADEVKVKPLRREDMSYLVRGELSLWVVCSIHTPNSLHSLQK